MVNSVSSAQPVSQSAWRAVDTETHSDESDSNGLVIGQQSKAYAPPEKWGNEYWNGYTTNHVAAGPSGMVDQLTDILIMSMEQLSAEIDELKSQFENGTVSSEDYLASRTRLLALTVELERRSLDVLEQFLVNSEPGASVYSPNRLTQDNLNSMANDDSLPPDVRIAAQFFLDNTGQFIELAGASHAESGLPAGDGVISVADIHVRQLELNRDIENNDAPINGSGDQYVLPNGSGVTIGQLDSPQRDQAEYDLQQDAIEEAIRTGEEVEFVNSDGETLTVRVETHESGVLSDRFERANYTVHVDDDSFTLESEISIGDTIAGIASIIEFGTTMGTPEGIRQFPDSVVFQKESWETEDGMVGATYNSQHEMTFYSGDRYIDDPELYYHELGHGIGRDLNEIEVSEFSLWAEYAPIAGSSSSVPPGWKEVHDAANATGNLTTDYAETNYAESFAEAFASYVNARNYGEAALNEFREAYPLQAAYIDEHIFGITSNVT